LLKLYLVLFAMPPPPPHPFCFVLPDCFARFLFPPETSAVSHKTMIFSPFGWRQCS